MIKSNIEKIISRHFITKVVILSAYSEPDFCFKNKKISDMLNVVSTIRGKVSVEVPSLAIKDELIQE